MSESEMSKDVTIGVHDQTPLPVEQHQVPCASTHDWLQDPLCDNHTLFVDAQSFLNVLKDESKLYSTLEQRLVDIQMELTQMQTYSHTADELAYGAQLAWRNNSCCIGRLYWKSLQVRDMRHLTTGGAIFETLVEHLRLATNRGKIRPIITVFASQKPDQPGIRIWNSQLVRYAGFRQGDGSVVGDPLNVELTELAMQLGWKGKGTAFEVLPLIIQMPYQAPQFYELPQDAVLEVPLSHPEYSWFEELELRWHAFPTISNMRLEIGGISYTAAPFSGWYVGTEIGARNLGDIARYNLLPTIAHKMGLDMDSDRSLWKDRALIELTAAVLHSFARDGVTMIDHHVASRHFIQHIAREAAMGRQTPAEWSWIVPPISSSATPVFHRSYKNMILKPNFFYQSEPWQELKGKANCPIH